MSTTISRHRFNLRVLVGQGNLHDCLLAVTIHVDRFKNALRQILLLRSGKFWHQKI